MFTKYLTSWVTWAIILIIIVSIIYFLRGRTNNYNAEGLREPNPTQIHFKPIIHQTTARLITRHNLSPPPPYDESSQILIENASVIIPIENPPETLSEPQVIEQPQFNVPYKSKGEEYTCRAASEIFQSQVIYGYRPNELKNPNTGYNLEIDCWIPEYNIGIEYDGSQHRQWVSKFQPTYTDFQRQVDNDRIKDQLCAKCGIKLLRIPDIVDMYKQTPTGPKLVRKRTPMERYTRIRDYIIHHSKYLYEYGTMNPEPHYTTSYLCENPFPLV